ncbi:probable RNA helicase armi [Sitodiplosis mosellana]|uniref:probable RNA helicase armi n=1 Tax=Sitodiplosis mosellana TaxID=263140 RepID=UPI00244476C0|nr:probable RNA helicase armi [Sitodiplosis mosellana]
MFKSNLDNKATATENNTQKDLKIGVKNKVKKETEEKIKSVIQKVEVPKLEREVFRVDVPKDDWIKEFRRQHPRTIEVDDNLTIKFDRDQCDKSVEIFIRNNAWKPFYLESIHIDLASVSVRGDVCTATIEPRHEMSIILDARFVPDRCVSVARVVFHFKNMGIVRRSIGISYHKKGPTIQRSLYEPPDDLMELICLERNISQSKVLDFLDARVPAVDDDYAGHFHSLLYLEEIGLTKAFKDMYNRGNAHFGTTLVSKQNGREIREKYERGVYDLTVNDLFETRPSLQMGDKLTVRKQSKPNISYEGVIIDIKEVDLIVVKFDDDFVKTFDHSAYSIEFSFSRSYAIRQHFAIDLALELFGLDILMPNEISLRGAPLLGENDEMVQQTHGKKLSWFNEHLNKQQKQAVQQIIRSDLLNPYLIFGPPGTGKTTTLVEIILQLLALGKEFKILILTQSNSASNLITQRLAQSKFLDSDSLLRLISYNYSSRSDVIPKDIEEYSKTIDDLVDGGKQMKLCKLLETVKSYRVVIGTFANISKLLESRSLRNHFTHSVIDEAGQCTEPDVLVPMVLIGKRGQTIMAGDPMQMPPLIINRHANNRGLGVSMLDRLIKSYSNFNNDDAGHKKNFGPCLISKLDLNYRSLPSILEYPNTQFYNSELIPTIDAESSREAKLLKHLDGIFKEIEKPGAYGIHFINVDGRNEKRETSWFNVAEVTVTKEIVDRLMQVKNNADEFILNEEDIGIITPYFLQFKALKRRHEKRPNIMIGTVEDFQGLERKVILISTVRTCPAAAIVDVDRQLGFVKCPNRINVATSRARVMVIVVGKADLLSRDKHWHALIAGCKENHTYRDSIMIQ